MDEPAPTTAPGVAAAAPASGAATTPDDAAAVAVSDLLDVLDLDEVGERHIAVSHGDDDATDRSTARVFSGRSQPTPHRRVFGGQVLAQCLIAAGRTVDAGPQRQVHSLHGYFLRPGDSHEPILFSVENMRDGRSFSARRVHALQDGRILLSMITSFQDRAGGLDHQDEMPVAPAPESLPPDQLADSSEDPATAMRSYRLAIDMRHVEGPIVHEPGASREPGQRVWMRAAGPLPDDPLVHAAVLAYSSDFSLLGSVLRRHGIAWVDPRLRVASLDHAMWFHRFARADDWVLYGQHSPSAQSGRGLGVGRMFSRDGTLVATLGQEGMVRIKE